MSDHRTLIQIWTLLRDGKNVLVFLDSDEVYREAVTRISGWFQPLIKDRLNKDEFLIQNGTFLVFRELQWGVNETTRGSYEIVAVGKPELTELLLSLQKDVK